MSKVLRTQYNEFLSIPTYVRKYIIKRIVEDYTPKEK
jgi:hypothetical protein